MILNSDSLTFVRPVGLSCNMAACESTERNIAYLFINLAAYGNRVYRHNRSFVVLILCVSIILNCAYYCCCRHNWLFKMKHRSWYSLIKNQWSSHLGQLSLLSLQARYQPYWLVLRRGEFACVGWQVTFCDPIWHLTSRSSEMGFPWRTYLVLNFF